MNTQWTLAAALVLFLAALPLVSVGTTRHTPILWWSGLALMLLAGVLAMGTRFLEDKGNEGSKGSEGNGGSKDNKGRSSRAEAGVTPGGKPPRDTPRRVREQQEKADASRERKSKRRSGRS